MGKFADVDNFFKNTMKKTAIALAGVLVASASFAGNQTGTVQSLTVRDTDGLVSFTLEGGARVQPAPCATQAYWIIRNESSVAGKQLFALLMAAQAAGKTIVVNGANACTRWGDGEDVRDISVLH